MCLPYLTIPGLGPCQIGTNAVRDRHKCKRRSRQRTNTSFSESTKTRLSQRVYTSLSVSMLVETDDSPGPGQTEESIMVYRRGVWRAFFSLFDWKCRLLEITSLLVAPRFIASCRLPFILSDYQSFPPRQTSNHSSTIFHKVHPADARVNHVSVRNNHQYDQCHQEERHHHTRPARRTQGCSKPMGCGAWQG
jgi:hypothetical protein